jgi:hypothetical protein
LTTLDRKLTDMTSIHPTESAVPSAPTAPGSLGQRFAQALRDRDPGRLKALLGEKVDFRAMTPTRFWESTDPDAVVDETILGIWFAPERGRIELLSVDCDEVGPVERVGYRLRIEGSDGPSVVEQQAYLRATGGRVEWLRIMCTGFLPGTD